MASHLSCNIAAGVVAVAGASRVALAGVVLPVDCFEAGQGPSCSCAVWNAGGITSSAAEVEAACQQRRSSCMPQPGSALLIAVLLQKVQLFIAWSTMAVAYLRCVCHRGPQGLAGELSRLLW
jgi:hypothetical protein